VVTEFDTSCFSGVYVTGDITPEYLARLQAERSDVARPSGMPPAPVAFPQVVGGL